MGRFIGYMRVSTYQQKFTRQSRLLCAFKKSHLDEKIVIYPTYYDRCTGITAVGKRELVKAINALGYGDVLVVADISRLSRSFIQLCYIISKIIRKHARIYSVQEDLWITENMKEISALAGYMVSAQVYRDEKVLHGQMMQKAEHEKPRKRNHNYPSKRKRRPLKLDPYKDDVILAVESEWTRSAIADYFHVSEKTVTDTLKAWGVIKPAQNIWAKSTHDKCIFPDEFPIEDWEDEDQDDKEKQKENDLDVFLNSI